MWLSGKECASQAGDLIPGFDPWVRKIPWRRDQLPTPLFLENSTDCIVHRVTKSWTQLSDFHFHFSLWWQKPTQHCKAIILQSKKKKKKKRPPSQINTVPVEWHKLLINQVDKESGHPNPWSSPFRKAPGGLDNWPLEWPRFSLHTPSLPLLCFPSATEGWILETLDPYPQTLIKGEPQVCTPSPSSLYLWSGCMVLGRVRYLPRFVSNKSHSSKFPEAWC